MIQNEKWANMTPAQRVAAVLAASAIAVPVIATFEGYERRGYFDPVNIPTAGYGHTGGVEVGKLYTDAQIAEWLASDAAKHGLEISRCLPDSLPDRTRAAFTSLAFNIGTTKFCGSTLARKANAGDLAGACAELSRWSYAGGKQLAGLVRRRTAERSLCEAGLV